MRAVIFDMDGVIFDSERVVYEIWKELAPRFSFDNMEEVHPLCIGVNGIGRKHIFEEKCGADFPLEAFDQAVRAEFLRRYSRGRLPVKAGARELLAALDRAGIPLALASSTPSAAICRELEEAGLLQHFDYVIGGDRVARSKPAPDIFLAAAKGLSESPEDCFVIEDSYNGIRAARAAGMHPIMVPDMKPADGEMRKKADIILPDLFAVLHFLKNWLKIAEEEDV